ncbi:MAG: 30S ribosomal protein S15 [Candidatus Hadarchaeum sp.]|uniref:30S ribosomal protein S15 n=1 Tax=Candidatus Hadarchaeum sp. TaxID=2883567 RepID=UPI00316CE4D1
MAARKAGLSLGRGAVLSAGEVEELVVKLGKEGVPLSKIGLILRDQHAVPDIKKITGKSVKEILEANGIKSELPEDLVNVIRNAVRIATHLGRNPKDFRTKRSLERVEARVNKLATYYKRKGILPADWRYDRERAALLVRG